MPTNETTNTPYNAERLAINAEWLAKLRWVAVLGQLATVAVAAGPLGVPLPLVCLLGLIAITTVTNGLFTLWIFHHRSQASDETGEPSIDAGQWHLVLAGLMLLDLLVLTAMLGRTGGPTNPFVVFYFVNLALCGVILPTRWAWLLSGIAVAAFAFISFFHSPLPLLRDPQRLFSFGEAGYISMVGLGSLAAFAACAMVVVSFVTRLTSELQRNQEARFRIEKLRARSEKLEALGTLAAGAAHELATPLSTIAVVAKELQRELNACEVTPDVTADMELIRSELDRCRTILDRMSQDSGTAAGEALVEMTIADLLTSVLTELPNGSAVQVKYQGNGDRVRLTVPPTALAQALRALVKNGLDAGHGEPVYVTATAAMQSAELTIQDSGPGMPTEVLTRAGEPFFTTKEPGSGMGLGLFLARSVIERLGGTLRLESPEGEGATVRVRLPTVGDHGEIKPAETQPLPRKH